MEIKTGILAEQHLGKTKLNEGQLHISYNQNEPILSSVTNPLLTFKFKANKTGQTNSAIYIFEHGVSSEAYSNELEIHRLKLSFGGENTDLSAVRVYLPQPNPMSDVTTLRFYLPESGLVTLTLFTANGKVLKKMVSNFSRGHSDITIKSSDLVPHGLVFYHFDSAHGTASGKILIKG